MIIIALNIITLAILSRILFLLLKNGLKSKKQSELVLLLAFSSLFIATLFNLPEHILRTTFFDEIEVLLEVLFIPILILAIHLSVIDEELEKRKISEQRFMAIFDKAYSLVGLLDSNGVVVEANRSALRMAEVEDAEVHNIPFQDTIWWSHSEVEKHKLIDALAESKLGKVIRFETSHLNGNNELRSIDFSMTPVFDSNKELINYVVEGRDITELKNIQLELEYHKNHLESLVKEKTRELETTNAELSIKNMELNNKNEIINQQNTELKEAFHELKETQSQLIQIEKMASLGTLTAGVAHEINNPLNYIIGGYHALMSHLNEVQDTDSENISFLLDSIKIGTERITDIVNSLNHFSRNNDALNEECDIHEILNNSLIMLQNKIKHKGRVVKHFNQSPIFVNGNDGKLHQVFLNILSNAVQAIDQDGEIVISTTINDSKMAVIVIEDTGHGISEDHMKKIMDPFFTTKAPGEGTGLGLSISYSILKDHNGDMFFDSTVGTGTKVTVLLPIKSLL